MKFYDYSAVIRGYCMRLSVFFLIAGMLFVFLFLGCAAQERKDITLEEKQAAFTSTVKTIMADADDGLASLAAYLEKHGLPYRITNKEETLFQEAAGKMEDGDQAVFIIFDTEKSTEIIKIIAETYNICYVIVDSRHEYKGIVFDQQFLAL